MRITLFIVIHLFCFNLVAQDTLTNKKIVNNGGSQEYQENITNSSTWNNLAANLVSWRDGKTNDENPSSYLESNYLNTYQNTSFNLLDEDEASEAFALDRAIIDSLHPSYLREMLNDGPLALRVENGDSTSTYYAPRQNCLPDSTQSQDQNSSPDSLTVNLQSPQVQTIIVQRIDENGRAQSITVDVNSLFNGQNRTEVMGTNRINADENRRRRRRRRARRREQVSMEEANRVAQEAVDVALEGNRRSEELALEALERNRILENEAKQREENERARREADRVVGEITVGIVEESTRRQLEEHNNNPAVRARRFVTELYEDLTGNGQDAAAGREQSIRTIQQITGCTREEALTKYNNYIREHRSSN